MTSPDPLIQSILSKVSADELRRTVETISVPRNDYAQKAQNEWTGDWIAEKFRSYGYRVEFQGPFRNILAFHPNFSDGELTVVGAHYDSVRGTPGADDNASAVAGMLECARIIATLDMPPPLCFIAFNCEEDGIVGSIDFVENYLPTAGFKVSVAHILEMIGYCSDAPGSQIVPRGIPLEIPNIGNFVGIVANEGANHVIDSAEKNSTLYRPDLPLLGLRSFPGIEHILHIIGRSDHYPFWEAGIPAVMWTDTADFRNPNYHKETDTPDTLDYEFMRRITQVVLAGLL